MAYAADGETIGQAIERHMQGLQPDDWAIMLDHDMQWTTPDWYPAIAKAIAANPQMQVLTCITNRAHQLNSPYQMAKGVDVNNHDIKYHRQLGAKLLKLNGTKVLDVTNHSRCINGVVVIWQRKTWDAIKKMEGHVSLVNRKDILMFDTKLHKRAKGLGMKVGVLQGVYVYHWYRGDGQIHIK